MDTCCGRRLSYRHCTGCCLWQQIAQEEQGWNRSDIHKEGSDFGWMDPAAAAGRGGGWHSRKVVGSGPAKGVCGIRKWCHCRMWSLLKRFLKSSWCIWAGDQPRYDGGFWLQVICRDPGELAVEIGSGIKQNRLGTVVNGNLQWSWAFSRERKRKAEPQGPKERRWGWGWGVPPNRIEPVISTGVRNWDAVEEGVWTWSRKILSPDPCYSTQNLATSRNSSCFSRSQFHL